MIKVTRNSKQELQGNTAYCSKLAGKLYYYFTSYRYTSNSDN